MGRGIRKRRKHYWLSSEYKRKRSLWYQILEKKGFQDLELPKKYQNFRGNGQLKKGFQQRLAQKLQQDQNKAQKLYKFRQDLLYKGVFKSRELPTTLRIHSLKNRSPQGSRPQKLSTVVNKYGNNNPHVRVPARFHREPAGAPEVDLCENTSKEDDRSSLRASMTVEKRREGYFDLPFPPDDEKEER